MVYTQRYLSPAEYLPMIIIPRQQQYPDLKLGQIVHRRNPTSLLFPSQRFQQTSDPSPQRNLRASTPTNNQIFPNKIYAQDPQRSISQLLLFLIALISRLETWSDSASEESRTSLSPPRQGFQQLHPQAEVRNPQ